MSSRFSFNDVTGTGTVYLDNPLTIKQNSEDMKIDFISFKKPTFQYIEKTVAFKSSLVDCMQDVDKVIKQREALIPEDEKPPVQEKAVPQGTNETPDHSENIEAMASTLVNVPVESLAKAIKRFKEYIEATKAVLLGNTGIDLKISNLNSMQETDVYIVIVSLHFFLLQSSTIKSRTDYTTA